VQHIAFLVDVAYCDTSEHQTIGAGHVLQHTLFSACRNFLIRTHQSILAFLSFLIDLQSSRLLQQRASEFDGLYFVQLAFKNTVSNACQYRYGTISEKAFEPPTIYTLTPFRKEITEIYAYYNGSTGYRNVL
jgi:hypothetical protein